MLEKQGQIVGKVFIKLWLGAENKQRKDLRMEVEIFELTKHSTLPVDPAKAKLYRHCYY